MWWAASTEPTSCALWRDTTQGQAGGRRCLFGNQWKRREDPLQVKSMGTARSGVAAAALDGALYVVGGWDGTRRLRTGEVINNNHLLIAKKHC